jgi:hypothetical protein
LTLTLVVSTTTRHFENFVSVNDTPGCPPSTAPTGERSIESTYFPPIT